MKYNYNDDINWFKFVCLLRNKTFRFWLKQTIFYALNHFNEKRGEGASDVLFFNKFYSHKIVKGNHND